MRNKMRIYGTTFYGYEISDYGKEHNRLDYGTLSKAFDCVLNNTIISIMPEYWEPVSYTNNDDEIEELKDKIEELEDYTPEVYQWYIVDEPGTHLLGEIGEIVFYNSELDIYLWGVTHYGTSWDYVLTDIPCNTREVE